MRRRGQAHCASDRSQPVSRFTQVTRKKPWYSRCDVPLAAWDTSANLSRAILWGIKAALCDDHTTGTTDVARPAGSKWVVIQSCDGSSVSSSDLWGSTYNAAALNFKSGVFPNQPRSWILLQSPAALGVYCCLGFGDSPAPFHISFSKTAYTPYATNPHMAIPRSIDLFGWGAPINNPANNEWFPVSSGVTTATEHLLHFTVADDGQFHFVITLTAASPARGHFYFGCVKTVDFDPADEHTVWCLWSVAATGVSGLVTHGAPNWSALSSAGLQGRGWNLATDTDSWPIDTGLNQWSWGSSGGGVGSLAGNVTQQGPDPAIAFPLHIYQRHNSIANRNRWRGYIEDVYLAPIASNCGIPSPVTGDTEFHTVGDLLLPFGVGLSPMSDGKSPMDWHLRAFDPEVTPTTIVETVVVREPRNEDNLKTHIVRSPGTDRYSLKIPASALDLSDYNIGAGIGQVDTPVTSANAADTVLTLESSSELVNFTLVGGVLVPSVDGLFSVSIDVQWDFDAGASIKRILTAWVNGADAGSMTFYGTVATLQTDQFTTLIRLEAGDTVTIQASQDGGGNTSEVSTAHIRLAYVSP